ncbi:D-aminoacid aminotransferase-like PLP-dependent enzyme [Fragilariopsis cylindrus CCMP1102]|uniref:D-aminoacid aminotransferase-like PLP-dependent enzyme n=1 Tax=Fragilariopsis cylindrus CCMP1102 TaxID=635003 RepID=A0A1E7EY13_9STRA|nr:D-aminoacid aminotransferase-like PLP-dependent enzyme [Fragilariopsis cylindrus CCMP1102]|eukprot:OEU10709.1 D-aminoacid aminotransferase-like PLP-dependent enzyme [Fragilariopsis cylindrus CCMP1102]
MMFHNKNKSGVILLASRLLSMTASSSSFCDAFQQRTTVFSSISSTSTSTRRNNNNKDNNSRLYMSSTTDTTKTKKMPGTADMGMPWEDLGFEFRPTNSHVKLTWKDGEGWSEPELIKEPYVNIHIGATVLHYGQACFEGLKAFTHEDNEVYCFRPEENAARMQSSCRRIMMPELPTDMFVNAVQTVVKDNIEYVPPYGSNGALYIRPLLLDQFSSDNRFKISSFDESNSCSYDSNDSH